MELFIPKPKASYWLLLNIWLFLCLGLGLCFGFQALAAEPEALLDAGRKAQGQGRYSEAIVLYSRGLEATPQDIRLLRMRAEAFQYLGNLAKAEADLRAGLALAPDDPALLEGMGWLKLFEKDFTGAESWLRKSLVQEPENFWAQLNLAHALMLQQRLPEARALYCRLAQTPDGQGLGTYMHKDFGKLQQQKIVHPLFEEWADQFTSRCGVGLILPADCAPLPRD